MSQIKLPKLRKIDPNKPKKKKILLLSDDLRMHSGIATMSKEFVLGTVDKYDWIQLGAAVKHPDEGKVFDISDAISNDTGVSDANVKIYATSGYGNERVLKEVMATEKPEMFARTSHREVHCGHLHKEMVNEYRGIKVRFVPSICPNDEWHKQMGYEAKRTGQAYIWNKHKGLEGYLQSNVRV